MKSRRFTEAPPDIGQPEVPELPKLTEPEPELERWLERVSNRS